jgi:hypothetical protein
LGSFVGFAVQLAAEIAAHGTRTNRSSSRAKAQTLLGYPGGGVHAEARSNVARGTAVTEKLAFERRV